jgi:hypothetical protein
MTIALGSQFEASGDKMDASQPKPGALNGMLLLQHSTVDPTSRREKD